MTTLGIIGAIFIGLLISVIIYGPILAYFGYIPKTQKLRITTKGTGPYTFYRSEFYRFIFGWTGFSCSKYNGRIWTDTSWTNDKSDCEANITIYKNLKGIN